MLNFELQYRIQKQYIMIIALKTVITYLIYLLLEVIRSGILMYLDQVSFCLLQMRRKRKYHMLQV